MDRVTVITPSYRPDLGITMQMARSLDRHFQGPFRHIVVVPRRDHARFAPLAGPAREVLVAEELLRPHGFFKLPLPSRLRIPGLVDRRLREQWWKRGEGRVTGWLVQQLVKLQAAELTGDETLVFIDSDLEFVRDVDAGLFHVGDRLRLHLSPNPLASDAHRQWRGNAIRLLGLDGEAVGMEGFVGNVITWRRSVLLAMLSRIEQQSGTDWRTALVQAREVSEYMLYGYFARHGLPDDGGHRAETFDRVHSLWTGDEAARLQFRHGLRDRHAAIHIQSAVTADVATRRRMIAETMEGCLAA